MAERVPTGRRRDGKATTSRSGRPVRALRSPSCEQKGGRSIARLRPPHRASVLRPLPLAGTGKKVALASRSDSPSLPIAGREGPLASPCRPVARTRVRSWWCRDQYQWRSGRGLSSRITSKGGPALFRADLELNLPSAIRVRVPHPKLKDAKLGDDGADEDRHRLPHRDVLCRDRDLEHASVVKLTLGVGEDLSRRITASYRG